MGLNRYLEIVQKHTKHTVLKHHAADVLIVGCMTAVKNDVMNNNII